MVNVDSIELFLKENLIFGVVVPSVRVRGLVLIATLIVKSPPIPLFYRTSAKSFLNWFMSLVYILLNTEPSQMESVLEEKNKGIKEAYIVYGIYDICANIKT